MASVEMSLDDIIAQNRKKKQFNNSGNRGGNRRQGDFGGRRSGGNFNGSRGQQGGRPRGYVDHDAPRSGPIISSSGNPNKMVRVNISNLAGTVVSSDLEELFGAYNLETATVHYNERGESCGTGDIYLRKRDAERVVKDFRGVALDGQVMRLLLTDGSQDMSSRVDFTSPRQGGVQRRQGPSRPRGGNGFRNDRGPRSDRGGGRRPRNDRPQKTEAELDAELDAYMSKPKMEQ